MIKKITLLTIFILPFLCRLAVAQEVIDTPIVHDLTQKVYKTYLVKGRVLGVNLEFVQSVVVTNKRTAENATTDNNGIFHITAATGDTLAFYIAKYSRDTLRVQSPKENVNLIMMKRKTESLPRGYTERQHNDAKKQDNELYRILVKDAKMEDRWKY